MNVKQFSIDSPLGIGWLTGHVALEQAIAALCETSGLTPAEVRAKYDIKGDT